MEDTKTDPERVEGALLYLNAIDRDKYDDDIADPLEEIIDDLENLSLRLESERNSAHDE